MGRGRLGDKLQRLSDEEILDLRLADLPIKLDGTPLSNHIRRLYQELEDHNLPFKPHIWLSSEFFSPDNVPGIAVPFYLAHPRLIELERKQMLEVEGGTENECLRILRHEAGHAFDTAYQIHRRRRWRELFGSYRTPYPETYKPRPRSRNYVLHLRAWYAQSHPAEDFAETFAVWLSPRSRWRQVYRDWPALEKLEFVDQVMREIVGEPPRNRARRTVEPLSTLRITLREHYERRHEQYSIEWPDVYDKDLRRIFSTDLRYEKRPTAASFLRKIRPELRELVAEGTGVHQYTINQVMQHMIERCKELRLRLPISEEEAKKKVMIMLTAQIMNVLHSGYPPVAL